MYNLSTSYERYLSCRLCVMCPLPAYRSVCQQDHVITTLWHTSRQWSSQPVTEYYKSVLLYIITVIQEIIIGKSGSRLIYWVPCFLHFHTSNMNGSNSIAGQNIVTNNTCTTNKSTHQTGGVVLSGTSNTLVSWPSFHSKPHVYYNYLRIF